MQFSVLAFSVSVLSFLGGVTARNCTPGLYYCGHTLLGIGNYWDDIESALHKHGQFGGEQNALFICQGSNGGIEYVQMCANCHDAGHNNNDYC